MTEHVIEIEGLRKTYGGVAALDGLDLSVGRGEVHGFLGPNGAGKSTTIRVLLGLTRADSGRASLFGGDPWKDAVSLHERLAYVPGDVTLWPRLTGGQCIDVLARAHGRIDEARRADLVERFDFDPTKRARSYSKGNRQKVSLIAALATDAELLVLDEPTSGLDPLMEAEFQACVRERRADGVTVLLSSHIMGEVEALADRVSIIKQGRTVTSGTLAELRRHMHSDVRAVLEREPDLTGLAGVEVVHAGVAPEGRHELHLTAEPDAVGSLVGRLHERGLHTLTVTPPSLDDLFRSAYDARATAAPGARVVSRGAS
jgi:ABC-2 type transport system ATP-binding protein